MKRIILSVFIVFISSAIYAQTDRELLQESRRLLNEFDQDLPLDSTVVKDTLPNMIPMLLPDELFIPEDRLAGITPWRSAPIVRPVAHVIHIDGMSGLIAAGAFCQDHPDKFFSTFNGSNIIDVPQLFLSQQKFFGNTLKLGRKLYFVSGIMYGAQLGVRGNNWGMGTREGVFWRVTEDFTILIWNQYFQSVSVYAPVLISSPDGDTAAVLMPATPEVFSFGVQASFTVGEFIIGVGTSVAPVPFQKRHHSELHYR